MGWGQKVKLYIFIESSHVAYQIKDNWAQSTIKANVLSLHTPAIPGVGSKGHFVFFSISGHVAYKIKVDEV